MIDYTKFYQFISQSNLAGFSDTLRASIDTAFTNSDITSWESSLNNFPAIIPSAVDFTNAAVKIGTASDCSLEEKVRLEKQLRMFHPWRKGPYEIFGIYIDTEWRSDWKWDRIRNDITPPAGRNILDVGCGNGYHCLRMLGEGAHSVIGIDPYLLSVYQFHVITRFIIEAIPAWVLPLKMEQFPENSRYFDTTLSLGVLYHRRSPFDHLYELKDSLRPGGELVLETLVINGKEGEVLVPEERYAKMRNVWFIPSELTLESWLRRCGFRNIKYTGTTVTTIDEQRSTGWMEYESLSDFLHPEDKTKTIEGYPAPARGIFIAEAP
jgi:tRNA (mo5U34)-methyltransferase